MKIIVCWKWVQIDGGADPDARWAGVSAADEAALEIGLQLAGDDGTVTVVCAGPSGGDEVLRRALAVGATRAIRVDCEHAASADVAMAISRVAVDSDLVLCGDYSLDRGTGSVPASLAHHLDARQALGLVEVDVDAHPLRVVRRLDGGRREVLDVTTPAVLSVEGSVARLRRASLTATLRAKHADIDVMAGPAPERNDAIIIPFRPRPRVVAPPSGNPLARVRDILDVGTADVGRAETVTLEPVAAAERIVEQLTTWGYLP